MTEAQKRAKRNWYLKNTEKAKAIAKRWVEANPERARFLKREWARRNRERATHIQQKQYGIALTPEEYADLLTKQASVCAICGKPPRYKRLAVDHCRTTGKVRGLLCTGCSIGVGWFERFQIESEFDKLSKYLLQYTGADLDNG